MGGLPVLLRVPCTCLPDACQQHAPQLGSLQSKWACPHQLRITFRAPPLLCPAVNTPLGTGSNMTVIGWGSTAEGAGNADVLMSARVEYMDKGACNATYTGRVRDAQICAGGWF